MTEPDSPEAPAAPSVSVFLAGIQNATKREDSFKLRAMLEEATGSKGELVDDGVIGFGTYRYRGEDGDDEEGPLIAFAPRKRELVLYVMTGADSHAAILGRLGKHKHGGSCLYIKRLSDVDVEVLRELVVASVTQMRQRYPD